MIFKGLAIFAVLLAMPQAPLFAQATNIPGASRPVPPNSAASATAPLGAGGPSGKADCNGVPCDESQPRVVVSMPPPAPVLWTLHDRVSWAATLVLAVLGYVGIMVALSTLKKIERNTRGTEAAAAAAADLAQAALLNAQSVIDLERPWILISVEPSPGVENGFRVLATNRGRTPARIVDVSEQMLFAVDEKHLPRNPAYRSEEPPDALLLQIVLVPGESATILKFCRDDLKGVCNSAEKLKRVENWNEKLFLYGRVTYMDLISAPDKQMHATTWCCWYIHGRQKSGLVLAGPPDYNLHT